MHQAQPLASRPLTVRQVVTFMVSLTLTFIGASLLQANLTTQNSAHQLTFGLLGVLLMVTGFAVSLPGLLRTLGQFDRDHLRIGHQFPHPF